MRISICLGELRMLLFGMAQEIVMNQHNQYNQAEETYDAQHNNHCDSLPSTVRAKNKITSTEKIAQKIPFCKTDNVAKNSPAKYPARMILAKSPTIPAIDALDFGLNHFILYNKRYHGTDGVSSHSRVCEEQTMGIGWSHVGGFSRPSYGGNESDQRKTCAR